LLTVCVQAQCLVTGGVGGQCICLLRPTPNQMCASAYHAQRVSPDPTQLCLISMGLSISTSASYSANWQDLSSTPCAMLNGAQTWCLAVQSNVASSFMVVGLSLLSGRRLLVAGTLSEPVGFNMSMWNHAHEPCRSLMLADNLTSILELHSASECERWRLIGERAVLQFNLSADPVLFTSYLGMAESSGLSLQVLLFAFKHADWAQPGMVVARRMWHHIIPLLNASSRLFHQVTHQLEPSVAVVGDLMPWFAMRPNFTYSHHTNSSRRRLMNWKDNLQAVQTFSIDIANGNIANLAPNLAASWSTGPFSWPPDYDYHANQTCLAASIAYNITLLGMQSTISFYTKTGPSRPKLANTLQEAFPHFPRLNFSKIPTEPQIVSFFRTQLLTLLGIDMSVIKQYASKTDSSPSQLSNDLSALIECDFVAVQHCTKQRRSLWWGGIVVAVFFVAFSLVARFMGVPFVDYVLLMSYIPFTMWYVYGYSMTCLPLVPTCISSELLDLFHSLMPISIQWPTQLQKWPGCVDGSPGSDPLIAGTKDCFIPCTR